MINLTNGNFGIDGNTYDKEDLINLMTLQKQLLLSEDMIFSLEECANIWSRYSDDLADSWLYFPHDENNFLPTIKSSNFFTSFQDYAS